MTYECCDTSMTYACHEMTLTWLKTNHFYVVTEANNSLLYYPQAKFSIVFQLTILITAEIILDEMHAIIISIPQITRWAYHDIETGLSSNNQKIRECYLVQGKIFRWIYIHQRILTK